MIYYKHSEVLDMKNFNIEKSIKNISSSMEMEGLFIDERAKDWCRQLLQDNISMEDYIALVKQKAGVRT